jgi:hypothetical protein
MWAATGSAVAISLACGALVALAMALPTTTVLAVLAALVAGWLAGARAMWTHLARGWTDPPTCPHEPRRADGVTPVSWDGPNGARYYR